jgi:hypothetical protein
VALDIEGSNPSTHPITLKINPPPWFIRNTAKAEQLY